MPKAKLCFLLPEESQEFLEHTRGPIYLKVLSELDEWLRKEVKYCERVALQDARDKLHLLCQDNNIDLLEG
jgi:hypothetical protein